MSKQLSKETSTATMSLYGHNDAAAITTKATSIDDCNTSYCNKNDLNAFSESVAKLTFDFLDELQGDSSLEPGEVKTPPHGISPVTVQQNNVLVKNVLCKETLNKTLKTISQIETEACEEKVRAILELDAIKRREEAKVRSERTEKSRYTKPQQSQKHAKAEANSLQTKRKDPQISELNVEHKTEMKKAIAAAEDDDSEGLYSESDSSTEEHKATITTAKSYIFDEEIKNVSTQPLHFPMPTQQMPPFPPSENFMNFRHMRPFMRPDFMRGGFMGRGRGAMRGNMRFPGFRAPFFVPHGHIPRHHVPHGNQHRHHTPPPPRGHSPILPPNTNLLWTTTKPSISYAKSPKQSDHKLNEEIDKINTSLLPAKLNTRSKSSDVHKSPKSIDKDMREPKKQRRKSRSDERANKKNIEKIRKSLKKCKARNLDLITSHDLPNELTKIIEELEQKKNANCLVMPDAAPPNAEENGNTNIAAEHKPTVFDMFAESPPRSKGHKNVGIESKAQKARKAIEDSGRKKIEQNLTSTKEIVESENERSTTPPLPKVQTAIKLNENKKTPLQLAIETRNRIDKLLLEDDLQLELLQATKEKLLQKTKLSAEKKKEQKSQEAQRSASKNRYSGETKISEKQPIDIQDTKEKEPKDKEHKVKEHKEKEPKEKEPKEREPREKEPKEKQFKEKVQSSKEEKCKAKVSIDVHERKEMMESDKQPLCKNDVKYRNESMEERLDTNKEFKKLERNDEFAREKFASCRRTPSPLHKANRRRSPSPIEKPAKHLNPFRQNTTRSHYFGKIGDNRRTLSPHTRDVRNRNNRSPAERHDHHNRYSRERHSPSHHRRSDSNFRNESVNRSRSDEKERRRSATRPKDELKAGTTPNRQTEHASDNSYEINRNESLSKHNRHTKSKSPRHTSKSTQQHSTSFDEHNNVMIVTKNDSKKKHSPQTKTKLPLQTKKNHSKKLINTPLSFTASEFLFPDDDDCIEQLHDEEEAEVHTPKLKSRLNVVTSKKDNDDDSLDTDDYMDNWENEDSTTACDSSTPKKFSIIDDHKFETRFINPSPPKEFVNLLNETPKKTTPCKAEQETTTPNTTPPTPPIPPSMAITTNSGAKKELFQMQDVYDQFMKSVEMCGVDVQPIDSSPIADRKSDDEHEKKHDSFSNSSTSTSSSYSTSDASLSSSSSSTSASSSEESDADNSQDDTGDEEPNSPPLASLEVKSYKTSPQEFSTPPKSTKQFIQPTTPTVQSSEEKNAEELDRDTKKLKSLEANLARIQKMRDNFDSADEISEELLKMEKLFIIEKNAILQKYEKANTANQTTQPVEETETTAIVEPNKIFDSNREAIKLTISPLKLSRKPTIFNKVSNEKVHGLETDDKDFTEILIKPVKEIAIVKPIMDTKQKRSSQTRRTRERTRRSTSRSRMSRSKGRSLSMSPRRRGRQLSPQRRMGLAIPRYRHSIGRRGTLSRSRSPTNRRRRLNFGRKRNFARNSCSPVSGPRSPPLRRRSYSRERYSRSPLPFKPPSPPMRHSCSPSPPRSRSPRTSYSPQCQYFASNQDLNNSSYYYNLSPSQISLDAHFNIVLNEPQDDPNVGAYDSYANYAAYGNSGYMASAEECGYYANQYIPMPTPLPHQHQQPSYSNIPTIENAVNATPTAMTVYYNEFGEPLEMPLDMQPAVVPSMSTSVLRELPKAPTVAVQKGNVLEIVPTNDVPIASLPPENVEVDIKPPVEDVITSWEEEVNNRQVTAAVMRLSRESGGGTLGILRAAEETIEPETATATVTEKVTKKKVYFEDGIYPNRDSEEEDQKIIEATVQRAIKKYQAKKAKKSKLPEVDAALAALPPPPPPPDAPPPNLEQPVYILDKQNLRYYHFDPVVNSMFYSYDKRPIPPRLDPKFRHMFVNVNNPNITSAPVKGVSSGSKSPVGINEELNALPSMHTPPPNIIPTLPGTKPTFHEITTTPPPQSMPTHHVMQPDLRPPSTIGFVGMRINNFVRLGSSPLLRGMHNAAPRPIPVIGMRYNFPPPNIYPSGSHIRFMPPPQTPPPHTPPPKHFNVTPIPAASPNKMPPPEYPAPSISDNTTIKDVHKASFEPKEAEPNVMIVSKAETECSSVIAENATNTTLEKSSQDKVEQPALALSTPLLTEPTPAQKTIVENT